MKKFLLSSTAVFDKPDDKGAADPEAARKAEIQKQRDSIEVKTVKIEDEEEKEVEAKDEEKEEKEDDKDDEQKEEDGEEETEEKDEEKEDNEKDAKAEKKLERLERKIVREAQKRRDAEKELKALKAKQDAKGDDVLTEEDVEKRSEIKAQEKALIKELNDTADKLADGAQKHLKMKTKEFDALIKETLDDLQLENGFPGELVGALGDIENGSVVLAHLLKNADELEDIIQLKGRPVKLGLELAKLAAKLSTPKTKKISQVPDPIEPLGGKSAGGDRLAILNSKKNLSAEEMAEWTQARNADIEQKRKNGRMNLR